MSEARALDWMPSAIVGDHELAAEEKGPIDIDIVRTAVRITTFAGIPTLVAQWRKEDRERTGKKPGPKPWLPPAAIATLSLILTLINRPIQVTEMRKLLMTRFTPEAWALLNVEPPRGASATAVYFRIRNSREIVKRLINPEPGSLYREMSLDEVEAMQAARDPADCEMRRSRGLVWANAILNGTVRLLPQHAIDAYGGDLVIDATDVDTPARRGTKVDAQGSDRASCDPEAGWHVREGDHDGTPITTRAKKKYRRTQGKKTWAREVTTAVWLGNDPAGTPEFPHMVVAMTLDTPGKRLARNALAVIDAHLANGHEAGLLITDRAYLPRSIPDTLQVPARRRGYELVMDYDSSKTMLGVQVGHEGAILVEGTWYCPSMPEGLQNASFDYMMREEDDPRRISGQEYRRRIAQRVKYELRRKERPDPDGYTRRMCPAAGPSATVVCPLQEQHASARRKTGLTLIRSANLLDPPPKVCTNQSSLTFPPSLGIKYEQKFAYKGPQWQAHYTYGRQTVESLNAYIKSGDSSIEPPKHRPARGWASQLMALAPMIAASNVRKIITWQKSGPHKPTQRKRRRDNLDDIAA